MDDKNVIIGLRLVFMTTVYTQYGCYNKNSSHDIECYEMNPFHSY